MVRPCRIVLADDLPTDAATAVIVPLRVRASLILAALMPDMDANGCMCGGTLCVVD
jgi:hypothetical protein